MPALCTLIRSWRGIGSPPGELQRQNLFVVADEGDGLIGDPLRCLQTLRLGDYLVHGGEIDQASFVESDGSLGAQNLENRLVDARFRDFSAAHGVEHAIVGGTNVGRE